MENFTNVFPAKFRKQCIIPIIVFFGLLQPAMAQYFSKAAGNLHNVMTWGINPDGSGANPPDFGAGKTFNLANRAGVYTMTGNWTVGGTLVNPAGSQLQIGAFTLSVADLIGGGTLSGTMASNLVLTGTAGGNQALNFTPGGNNLGMLTINRSGAGAAATLGSALNIYTVLNVQNGMFNTGNMLTLKSRATTTARVAPVLGTINGMATVEQYIPARRAWRMINAPVGSTGGATLGWANLTHSQETTQGTFLTSGGSLRPASYGTATFSLNATRTALMFTATLYNIDVTGTQTPDDNNDNLGAAHIHVGSLPGSNAPVRWGFFGLPDNDINPKNTTLTPFATGVGGTFTGTWDLPEGNASTTLTDNLPAILNGLSYINFHTAQFPGGEIRGQIYLPGEGTSGQASLTHSQETTRGTFLTSGLTPRPASYGTATFSLNAARTALMFTATIYNIDVTTLQTPDDNNDNLSAAHIHVGSLPGSNAPVRWGFFGAPDNDINPKNTTVTPFATGVGGTFTGTWDLPEGNAGTNLTDNLPAILNGLSYINFHTVQFPGGEVRGQIYMLGEGTQTIKQAWQENAANSAANPNPGFGTHITGGPMYGSAANGFDVNTKGISESSLKYYNNPTNSWLPLSNTNATLVGNTPFMLFIRGNRSINLYGPTVPPNVTVLRAMGNLITGDRTFPVAPNGFTAVPNPYQAPIDFSTLTRNNVDNLFYLWDPKLGGANGVGGYVTVSWNGSSYDITPAPVSPESQYIQPWQSFLVRSTGAAGSITIKESDKVSFTMGNVFRVNNSTVKPPVQQSLRINLQVKNEDNSWGLVDEILSSYHSSYSNKVDVMDIEKMPNFNESLSFIRDDKDLTIERRGLVSATDTLFLKIANTVKATYRLSFHPSNLGSAVPAFLEDLYQRVSTPVQMDRGTEVDFSVTADPASQNPARFRVVFGSSKLMDGSITLNKLQAEVSPNPVLGGRVNVRLINQPQGLYTVTVFSSAGQVVAERRIQHVGGTAMQTIETGGRLAKGIYQVRIGRDNTATTLKIMAD